ETGRDQPEYPSFFTKQSTCVIGYGDSIQRPRVSDKLDYEGELAFVIGRRCRHVPVDKAHQVIAGFTIANDVSVRDWQMRSPTMMIGKSFDTCGPLGPWIVTPDELGDPHNLAIKTWIDDELRQNGNTRQMIFNCYEMIAYLSQAMTLEPGDVITYCPIRLSKSRRIWMTINDMRSVRSESSYRSALLAHLIHILE
ncbi:MAG: fumarylacetoacetate hydrolase family protein, partial [Methylococcaceae bacterium]